MQGEAAFPHLDLVGVRVEPSGEFRVDHFDRFGRCGIEPSLEEERIRFECPFCRGRFRRLRPSGESNPTNQGLRIVGARRRRNHKCPRCRSTDRERLVLLYLQWGTDVLNDPNARKRKLLHVAPERRLRRLIERETHLGYLSMDLDASRAMVEADVTKPFAVAEATYDAAISSGTFTLGHVGSEPFDEIVRVLKPGAMFACTIHKDIWQPKGFAAKVSALEAAGALRTVDVSFDEFFQGLESTAMYCMFQRL